MRETWRNIKLCFLFLFENDTYPLPKSRAAFTDIYCDIIDFPKNHLNELALHMGTLEVEAAENSLTGKGDVVLDKNVFDAGFSVAFSMECLQKESAIIAKDFGL